MTIPIVYRVPAVSPVNVRLSEESVKSKALRWRSEGFGSMLFTEKWSKVELSGVVIPLPYMESEVVVDDVALAFGTSGSENQKLNLKNGEIKSICRIRFSFSCRPLFSKQGDKFTSRK